MAAARFPKNLVGISRDGSEVVSFNADDKKY